jgi:hypothetical protein
MKTCKIRATLCDAVVTLEEIQVSELQLEWKVSKQVTLTSSPVRIDRERKSTALLEPFHTEFAVEYDEQSRSYLSCPSSLTLLLLLSEHRVKTGGYTLFNLSSMLNEGQKEVNIEKTFGIIGSIRFTLRFEYSSLALESERIVPPVEPELDSEEYLGSYVRKALGTWAGELVKKYEKSATRAEARIRELESQKRDLTAKHWECLESEEGTCSK